MDIVAAWAMGCVFVVVLVRVQCGARDKEPLVKVYQRTIPYENDGDVFRLIPISDVHLGASTCNMDELEKTLKRYGKAKNTYLIDNGDACDFILRRDSKRYRESAVHPMFRGSEKLIDDQIDCYCALVEKYVEPGKLLGIASGNHHDCILKHHETDPTDRIAKRLKVENLGYCYYYRLLFKRDGKGYQELIVYGNHGWGEGGRTEGASITKYCNHARGIRGARVFLYGHDHQRWTKGVPYAEPILDKVHAVDTLVADCGTFKMTLSKDEIPDYGEMRGYPLRPIGTVIIEITTPTDATPIFGLRGIV